MFGCSCEHQQSDRHVNPSETPQPRCLDFQTQVGAVPKTGRYPNLRWNHPRTKILGAIQQQIIEVKTTERDGSATLQSKNTYLEITSQIFSEQIMIFKSDLTISKVYPTMEIKHTPKSSIQQFSNHRVSKTLTKDCILKKRCNHERGIHDKSSSFIYEIFLKK